MFKYFNPQIFYRYVLQLLVLIVTLSGCVPFFKKRDTCLPHLLIEFRPTFKVSTYWTAFIGKADTFFLHRFLKMAIYSLPLLMEQ